MEVRVIKGYEANRILQAENNEWLADGFSYWYGYVEGRGLIRDRNGRLVCYTTKRAAVDSFNYSKSFYFKVSRNELVKIDNI